MSEARINLFPPLLPFPLLFPFYFLFIWYSTSISLSENLLHFPSFPSLFPPFSFILRFSFPLHFPSSHLFFLVSFFPVSLSIPPHFFPSQLLLFCHISPQPQAYCRRFFFSSFLSPHALLPLINLILSNFLPPSLSNSSSPFLFSYFYLFFT